MGGIAPTKLVRARYATSAVFLLFGATLGAWTARIPAIKHNLALTDGELSLVLLSFAAGAIAGMQGAGRLADRYGSGRIMPFLAIAEGAALAAPAFAPTLLVLAITLLGFGAVHGMLNIAMNANAVEIQREWHKPIITSFHAIATRFGAAGLVRASALLSAFGLALALLVSHPIAGVAGFGCLGAGLACIAPQVFSAAGNRDPARAGQAIARVAAMGYAGFLVGPVLIGAAAQLSSLRLALIVPVVLTLFVAAMAFTLSSQTRLAPVVGNVVKYDI